MRNFFSLSVLFIFEMLFHCCTKESLPLNIPFENGKINTGLKLDIGHVSTDLPSNWSKCNYLVMELKSTTSQSIYIGLHTEEGYNELGFSFYITNGWVQCAIPLSYFRNKVIGKHDLTSTYNQRRKLFSADLRHGLRTPLEGVDSIGFRMIQPIGDQVLEIRSLKLSEEDPDDLYLENKPAIDRYGQWALGDFEGKIKEDAQLIKAWRDEEEKLRKAPVEPLYSPHGGILSERENPTGFFKVAKRNNCWWFIDPEGYPFLSFGVNYVHSLAGNVYHIIPDIYSIDPPVGFEVTADSPYSQWIPIAFWNLFRRYGGDIANLQTQNDELIVSRMNYWGLNTLGCWSDPALFISGQKPFKIMINQIGCESGYWGLPDIYLQDFETICKASIRKQINKYKDNPLLLGYSLGNEPAWVNHEEEVCKEIEQLPESRLIKKVLKEYLAEDDSPKRRKRFVHDLFRKYTEMVTREIRRIDKHHLILGIQFSDSLPDQEVLRVCQDYYDVYSFNCNQEVVCQDYIKNVVEQTGLPVFISECQFGSCDRGLNPSPVCFATQTGRGKAYEAYLEEAFTHPAVIGVCYSRWMDDHLLGRADGRNFNIGLVDITNRPYPAMQEAIIRISGRMYRIHGKE